MSIRDRIELKGVVTEELAEDTLTGGDWVIATEQNRELVILKFCGASEKRNT